MKRLFKRALIGLVAVFALIQLVPYGRAHDNPRVKGEPEWDSQATRELAVRACFDCHSNETRWPWYSHVAPMSWLVQRDVDEGREHLNFSDMAGSARHAGEAAEQVEEEKMPPWFYLPLHPGAKLSAEERARLIAGLRKTFPESGGHEHEHDDD